MSTSPDAGAADEIVESSPTRLTIRDVATVAGVSPATVSRALRGMDIVDARTRDRIVAVAKELNYRVSPAASRLATGRAGAIGIVTPFVGRWYFTEVFAGIEARLKAHDVDLLIHTTDGMTEMPGVAERLRRRVDGALVIGMSSKQRDYDELCALNVPVVLLGSTAPGLDSVAIDDRLGAELAVRHLAEQGHERIGLLTGRSLPTPIRPENDRLQGYLDVLTEFGLPTDSELRAIGDFTTAGGARGMRRLLELPSPPTAVFAMSDEMAYGAMRVLTDAGYRLGGHRAPGAVAVIGFDGHDLAEVFDLSTVSQPVRQLGEAAANLLMSRVAGVSSDTASGPSLSAPMEHTFPTELIIRGSSAG